MVTTREPSLRVGEPASLAFLPVYNAIVSLSTPDIDRLVASSAPVRGWMNGWNLTMLSVAVLWGGSLAISQITDNDAWWWYGTHLAMIVAVVLVLSVGMRHRRMGRSMLEAFEAVQLQDWDRAEKALLTLLSRPVRPGHARVEALLALASLAEAQNHYEGSQRVYEAILNGDEADPLQQHTTHLALASAMLRNGETADAVALIDKLERINLPEPLEAQVSLLSLFREVVMGHAHETLDKAARRRALFRNNLGTRAGYGYALLAAAYDRAEQAEPAEQNWHDATLLVRPEQLLDRFDMLKSVATKYPAAQRPLASKGPTAS